MTNIRLGEFPGRKVVEGGQVGLQGDARMTTGGYIGHRVPPPTSTFQNQTVTFEGDSRITTGGLS